MSNRSKFILASTFLLTQSAFALNLQSYRFTDSYRYSLLDDSLKEKFEGRYVVTASLATVHSPFYYSDTYLHTKRKDIIDSNNILTVGFSYYLNKNVSLGIDASGVHNTVFNDTQTSFGDTVLKSRINLKRTDSFSLSLNPQVFIPTGEEDRFTSQGSVGGALSVVAEKSISRFHLLASLGALSSKNNRYVDVDHRQLALAQIGASYDFTDKFNLNLEAFRNIPLVNDTLQDEGKYFVTGKHKTHKNFSTYFGGGITGWGDLQRDTYSAFVGIKLHEAAPVAQAVALAAAAPQRQVVVPREEIYFAHDRYKLTRKEMDKLDQYIEYLNDSPQGVHIEGYASRVGHPLYNMKLSRKRAQAVKEYLVQNGVREELLTTEGFGDKAPQLKDMSLNRKVNFKYNQ